MAESLCLVLLLSPEAQAGGHQATPPLPCPGSARPLGGVSGQAVQAQIPALSLSSHVAWPMALVVAQKQMRGSAEQKRGCRATLAHSAAWLLTQGPGAHRREEALPGKCCREAGCLRAAGRA